MMTSAATTSSTTGSTNTRGFQNIDQDPASRIALERFAATRDPRLRDELIRRYDRVVQWVVNRQAREPGRIDDLLQVGRIALLQALERYQPERGVRFTSYAIKIISGTLKHYYRDRVAMIRVPRPLQDLAAELPRMQDGLTNKLGRQPSESELAECAGVATSEICEALRVGEALKPQSLDERSDERSLAETVGTADQDIEALVEFAPLHGASTASKSGSSTSSASATSISGARAASRRALASRRCTYPAWSATAFAACAPISPAKRSPATRWRTDR